jgi:hypothetical protein
MSLDPCLTGLILADVLGHPVWGKFDVFTQFCCSYQYTITGQQKRGHQLSLQVLTKNYSLFDKIGASNHPCTINNKSTIKRRKKKKKKKKRRKKRRKRKERKRKRFIICYNKVTFLFHFAFFYLSII